MAESRSKKFVTPKILNSKSGFWHKNRRLYVSPYIKCSLGYKSVIFSKQFCKFVTKTFLLSNISVYVAFFNLISQHIYWKNYKNYKKQPNSFTFTVVFLRIIITLKNTIPVKHSIRRAHASFHYIIAYEVILCKYNEITICISNYTNTIRSI